MDDDIGGSNESIRDVGMDVVVTEGDQISPEESIPAKKFRNLQTAPTMPGRCGLATRSTFAQIATAN